MNPLKVQRGIPHPLGPISPTPKVKHFSQRSASFPQAPTAALVGGAVWSHLHNPGRGQGGGREELPRPCLMLPNWGPCSVLRVRTAWPSVHFPFLEGAESPEMLPSECLSLYS